MNPNGQPIGWNGSETERFLRKISINTARMFDGTPCWEWIGCKDTNGYGAFTTEAPNRRLVRAHRWAYSHWIQPIPDALTIDHLCRNRMCVNPFHLELVSKGINTLRGRSPIALNSTKIYCKRGHKLFGENIWFDSHGWRQCKTCRNIRNTWRNSRRKEERACQ